MPGPTWAPMVGPTEPRMTVTFSQPSSRRTAASTQSASFSASAETIVMGMAGSAM